MVEPDYITKIAQYPDEIEWLIQLFKDNKVTRYLEIGSRHGGSLWRIVNSLPAGAHAVAVDLPHGDGATLKPLTACVNALTNSGYDVHLVIGDSRHAKVIEQIRDLGPYDAVLIDADHAKQAVLADWVNYGPMARIVVFHDIAWKRTQEWRGKRIEVPEVWQELKRHYRHEEIAVDPTGQDNGIGVLWRE